MNLMIHHISKYLFSFYHIVCNNILLLLIRCWLQHGLFWREMVMMWQKWRRNARKHLKNSWIRIEIVSNIRRWTRDMIWWWDFYVGLWTQHWENSNFLLWIYCIFKYSQIYWNPLILELSQLCSTKCFLSSSSRKR